MIVGTAGHIDHGKSSLVMRLTGIDPSRLQEEKARGITIDLGFAYWSRPGGEVIGFVDVPGHERLVHNMLAGATGIDFVVLVIAADDGVMPQTREHLAIMDLLGLEHGLVALTKCDLVNAERIAVATREIENVLVGTALAGCEILPVSAATGAGVDVLAARLDAALSRVASRPKTGLFRLAVDRSFTLAGLGTAVTGTVLSGSVHLNDRVVVSPSGIEARVRSIHAQNRPVERGEAGQRCALVLSGAQISKAAVSRGDVVLDPAVHAPTTRIDASLRVLPSEPKPVAQWFPVKLHHGAAEVPGRLVLLADESIAPGETAFVQVVLERPIAAAASDRFIVRDTTSSRTIGGGVLIDLRAPERRRRTPERRAILTGLAEREPASALRRVLAAPGSWIDLGAFIRDRAMGEAAAAATVSELSLVTFPLGSSRAAMLPYSWERLKMRIGETLDGFHTQHPDRPGIGLEQLRLAGEKPPLPAPLFTAVLRKLIEAGEVSLDRTWVRRPGHEVRFSREEEEIWAAISPILAQEPYRPPRVRDIANDLCIPEAFVRRLMQMAARRGDVDEIAHDHFFLRSTVQRMAEIAIDVAGRSPTGKFAAADFRDRLNNGRKVAIQILEFFDRHGLTIRRQDLRRINTARIEFFAPKAQGSHGGVPLPVGRPDFKSGWGRQTVSGGFDSHPPPPATSELSR